MMLPPADFVPSLEHHLVLTCLSHIDALAGRFVAGSQLEQIAGERLDTFVLICAVKAMRHGWPLVFDLYFRSPIGRPGVDIATSPILRRAYANLVDVGLVDTAERTRARRPRLSDAGIDLLELVTTPAARELQSGASTRVSRLFLPITQRQPAPIRASLEQICTENAEAVMTAPTAELRRDLVAIAAELIATASASPLYEFDAWYASMSRAIRGGDRVARTYHAF